MWSIRANISCCVSFDQLLNMEALLHIYWLPHRLYSFVDENLDQDWETFSLCCNYQINELNYQIDELKKRVILLTELFLSFILAALNDLWINFRINWSFLKIQFAITRLISRKSSPSMNREASCCILLHLIKHYPIFCLFHFCYYYYVLSSRHLFQLFKEIIISQQVISHT